MQHTEIWETVSNLFLVFNNTFHIPSPVLIQRQLTTGDALNSENTLK